MQLKGKLTQRQTKYNKAKQGGSQQQRRCEGGSLASSTEGSRRPVSLLCVVFLKITRRHKHRWNLECWLFYCIKLIKVSVLLK